MHKTSHGNVTSYEKDNLGSDRITWALCPSYPS